MINKYDSCIFLGSDEFVEWGDIHRKMKPGAHVVAICPVLEHHRVTQRVEDAGFEIRDSILFLSMPCLIVALARVPLEGTVAQNVLQYGTGALNIDAGRIGSDSVSTHSRGKNGAFPKRPGEKTVEESGRKKDQREGLSHLERSGRWPANLIHDCSSNVVGSFPNTDPSGQGSRKNNVSLGSSSGGIYGKAGGFTSIEYFDKGGSAARFFYGVTEDNKLQGLVAYLHKLITPPRGRVMLYNLPQNTIILLEDMGFDVHGFSKDEV